MGRELLKRDLQAIRDAQEQARLKDEKIVQLEADKERLSAQITQLNADSLAFMDFVMANLTPPE